MSIFDSSSYPANHDALKQSITYLICKECAEGNQEELTAECISRVHGAEVLDVEKVMKEIMG